MGAVDYYKLAFSNSTLSINTITLDNKISFIAGLEAEIFLPFNINIWSLVVEPSYEHLKNAKSISIYSANLDLQSVTFPIGIRYTNYLNYNFKCYLNGLFIPSFCATFGSDLDINNTGKDIFQGNSYAFGAGASYKNLNAEFRYYSSRELLTNYIFWSTGYPRFAFLMSYTFYHKSGK
jgi:hypothetical protein